MNQARLRFKDLTTVHVLDCLLRWQSINDPSPEFKEASSCDLRRFEILIAVFAGAVVLAGMVLAPLLVYIVALADGRPGPASPTER